MKNALMREFDVMDKLSEEQFFTQIQQDRKDAIMIDLNRLWAMEETKARQRARDRNIKERGRNTNYFHAVANQRGRKTLIQSMEGPF